MIHGDSDFQIARLASSDVVGKTDHLKHFENLILANENWYPAISDWYRRKVLPGIRNEERVAFVGYLAETPTISAVVRKGPDAKFCHLKISHDLQDAHFGELFFTIMALEIRDLAKTIHFTLPETLWRSKEAFFKSFGFSSAEMAETQYRLFDRELRCYADFATVWRSILKKLPKLSRIYGCNSLTPDTDLVMSVTPKNAEEIVNRKKTVEIRRRFSTHWIGHKINLYATSPMMSLVGEARIARIVLQDPDSIWERYRDQIACDRYEFYSYTHNCEAIYAIELEDIERYRSAFSLKEMSQMAHCDLVPPQSYCTLERNRPWAKAVSIATYLASCARNQITFGAKFIGAFSRSSRDPEDTKTSNTQQVEFQFH
jgi:predicted transcriptional regulator